MKTVSGVGTVAGIDDLIDEVCIFFDPAHHFLCRFFPVLRSVFPGCDLKKAVVITWQSRSERPENGYKRFFC